MPKKVNKISRSLLSWYDREARDLPWRKSGKDKQDPYKVWISEIMLQQTTVSVVIPYFNAFIKKWPTNKELSQASLSEIQRAWSIKPSIGTHPFEVVDLFNSVGNSVDELIVNVGSLF